jgi:hypothetical protein
VSNDETAAQQQPGGDPDRERMRGQNLRNARLPDGGEKVGPGQDDAGLHDMGGNIGPASIRGSGAAPGGRPDDDAEPRSGYAQPRGYMAGRDDEWPETAGSDEKAVAARPDEIEPHVETPGPSPHPMPPDPPDVGARTGHPAQPDFRIQGPAPGEDPGVIDDEPGPGDTDLADIPDPPPEMPPTAEHVTADTDWVPDDEDDPDLGSGRVDAPDDGYLSDEGTAR